MNAGLKPSLTVVILAAIAASAPNAEPQEAVQYRRDVLRQKRVEKAGALQPQKVSPTEARIRAWEEAKFPTNWLIKGWRGLRPVIGGMPSGSGFVAGGGYVHGLENQRWQFEANGRYSTKGYQMYDAEATFPPAYAGRRIEVRLASAYRDLTSLRFFGLGNSSSEGDRSTYAIKDTNVQAYLWLNPRGLLSFGAQGGWLHAETASGDAGVPVDDIFDPGEIPGLATPSTDYVVTGAWVEADLRDKWEDPPVGIIFRATGERYDDRELDRFDFTRYVGDLKSYIPLGYRSRVLALRIRTSHATPYGGGEVPFYLMETLGGAKTIRGFSEFRFRDTRNLLLQAEYRWEVWTFVDFSFFFDAGKVFSDTSDFNFKNMHTGYGFGVRAHGPGGMVIRFDLARSNEGIAFHVSAGPSF